VESVELGDAVCKSITIFFSDIRDFTSITEAMYVNEVMEFLNTYLAFAVPAIAEEGGFVDKFIGDAIMAIFAQARTTFLAFFTCVCGVVCAVWC
jgi:class 3 adenylate cyclase